MLRRMLRGCLFRAVQQSLGSRGQEVQRETMAGGQGCSLIGQRPWLKAAQGEGSSERREGRAR